MSVRPKLYISQGIPEDGEAIKLYREQCEITMYDEKKGGVVSVPREEFLRSIKGVDAIHLAYSAKIDNEALDAAGLLKLSEIIVNCIIWCPQLKVIGTMSVGLDHLDLVECSRRTVKVRYTPDVLTDTVAEAAIALTLATARRHKEGMADVMNGVWGFTWSNSLYLCGKNIKGSTVGIVGLGRIGFEVARRLKAFGISHLMYCGRTPKDYASEVDGEFVAFDDLLKQSDFVIACCSINPSNHKLFSAEAFKKMKSSAILVNVSRGVLIDQDALYDALKTGELYAAGIDATTPEPLPVDHPLLTLPNCTVLPHLGSASINTRHAMANLTTRNILAGLKGEPLPAPVPSQK
ncbi:glyoxylate reductase/hydroxypyruvate reductase-like [Mercenaria mercenaria]|uniref:glyoxylate reductase/hydroxypyruvate reductase-like n=1 Tax=Mercenaria mercenaria TaxID=6596 RepID=UPI00234F2E2F|nr:glyoxylate reductase/hydroxypyruvate reductase-like [Mercenaria mercenaria]